MNKLFLKKIASFCAYQERTQQEVREKLQEFGVFFDEIEEIIVWLIQNNYLHEERFAKTFAGSKFRQKQWGRLKIKQALTQKNLSPYCISVAMKEIADEEYQECLQGLIEKKEKTLRKHTPLVRKQKLAQYALTKGYESSLVWKLIDLIDFNE